MSQKRRLLNLKIFMRYVQGRMSRIVNMLIKKDSRCILFVPQATCVKDGYDIINWTGDNALCLFHYMMESKAYDSYHYAVVVDFIDKIEDYISYCKDLNPNGIVSLVPRADTKKALRKAKFIFVSSSIFAFNSKSPGQTLVDLNYFTPFKNDYPFDEVFRRNIYMTRKCFDYVITTAHISSRIQALDLGLPLSSFLELGFPRNDIFYTKNSGLLLNFIRSKFIPDAEKIVMFTPTFRDYEEDESVKRDLFGYSSFDYNRLEVVLKKFHAVIVIKMHTLQVENVDIASIKEKCGSIILFDELEKRFTLYQCLAETDCLITDYTSVYFDFLHRDKPVIFNHYDIDEYSQQRGLSFYPIESFVAGSFVRKEEELLSALETILNGEDPYLNERHILRKQFDCHYDGKSAQRICDCFFSQDSQARLSDRVRIRNGSL